MTKYQHILWDWNGTLLDDVAECLEIINVCLAKRNLKLIDREEYLEKFEFPVKNYYEAIGFDFSRESFEEAGKEYIQAYAQKMFACRLHGSAREILQTINKAGLNQYVLSALNAEALQSCIKSFALQEFFTEVRGLADHYAFSKVDLGKKMFSELEITPDSALLIGDTLHDYEVAQALGIDCILVAAGHNSRRRLEKCNTRVFSSLEDLKTSLDALI